MIHDFDIERTRLVIADQKIWQSAQRIMDRYGDDALTEINKRIRELELNNQTGARDVWLRIRTAVETQVENKNRKPRQ